MAISDRNIVITPNRTATGKVQPKIVFTGADSSIGDSSAITLFANPENSGTLSFSGTAGQLFSITNDLTGTIFSVNDISGMPSLSINDQGIVQLAEFNGRVIIGDSIGSDDSASTLQVSGALTADSATLAGGITATHFNAKATQQTNTFRYFNEENAYISGFKGGYTYGGLSGDGGDGFAINWTNSNTAGRGFIWNRNGHLLSQGAAALTGHGKFTLAHSARIGYGEADTTTPGVTHALDVSGSVIADSATFAKITISNTGTIPASAIASGTIDSSRLPTGTFTSGGGADSAAIIALVDSDYVQARSTGTRGTLNNVNSRLFTGDNTTTAFELLNTPADSDDVFVFVNGVLQHTNTYSVSGNTVTLASAPDSSSSIDIRSHLIKSENVTLRDYKKYVYTLGGTVDSVSGADSAGATLTYDAGLVDVYVNGVRLVTDKDYTAGNGSQVVFDSALGAGNIVEVVSHSRASVFTPEITSADVSLSTTDSGQNIDSFAKASFRTYKFTAQISHAASSSFHSEEVLLVHNGTNVAMTTFGQVLLDSNLGSFDAFISGSNVQVKFSPTKTNTTVKLRGVRTPV